MLGLDFGLFGCALRQRTSASFSPTDLSGLVAWYDPGDLSTLFQDAAMMIPVTTSGTPVGAMRDKSGNGYHLTQATASARPVYHTNGSKHWLTTDGVNDFLQSSGLIATTSSSVILAAAFEMLSVPAGNGSIMSDANYQSGGVSVGWESGALSGEALGLSNSASGVERRDFELQLPLSPVVMAMFTGADSFAYLSGQTSLLGNDHIYSAPTKQLRMGRGTQGGRDGFGNLKFYGGVYAETDADDASLVIDWLEEQMNS